MDKIGWPKGQMSDAVYIDEAAHWSKELTRMRTRCPGDLENAMRAIERDYGVDYWFLWTLRYRRSRLKEISVSVYLRIRHAYDAERHRQARLLSHETEVAEIISGSAHPAVEQARAVVEDAPSASSLQPTLPPLNE